MAGPTDLFDLCQEYLDACAAGLVTAPGGAIPRTYVSPGPPPWDCEQLTVHSGGPAEADTVPLQPPLAPGHRPFETGAVHLVNVTATVLRCVPVTDGRRVPSAAALSDAARIINGDLWAIWHTVRSMYARGLIFSPDGIGSKRELFFDPAVPLPIEGGFGGWQIQVRVALDGYQELS